MRFQDYEGKINRKAIFLDVYQGETNFLSKKFVYSDINTYLCKRKIKQRRQKDTEFRQPDKLSEFFIYCHRKKY